MTSGHVASGVERKIGAAMLFVFFFAGVRGKKLKNKTGSEKKREKQKRSWGRAYFLGKGKKVFARAAAGLEPVRALNRSVRSCVAL